MISSKEMDNITNHSTVPPTSNTTDPYGSGTIEMNFWFKMGVYIAYGLMFVVGTSGNFMTCIILGKRKSKRSIHLLTFNLALSDLIVLLIYLPFQIYQTEIHFRWLLGTVPCRIVYNINSLTVNASIGTLVAITRDRYMAVMRPMEVRSRNTNATKWAIVGVWLGSFAITLPLLIVTDVEEEYCGDTWPTANLMQAYWILVFVIQFVIALMFITCTYAVIIRHLWTTPVPTEVTSHMHNGSNKSSKSSKTSSRHTRFNHRKVQQNRMLKMTIILVIAYAVCVFPQHFFWFLNTFATVDTHDMTVYLFVLSNFLMILNSAINPVVYGLLNDEIKKGIKRIVLCKPEKLNENVDSVVMSMRRTMKRPWRRSSSSGSGTLISTMKETTKLTSAAYSPSDPIIKEERQINDVRH